MIKVMIERHIIEDLEEPYRQASKQTLRHASKAPGFITGESLQDCHKPNHHYVISLWRSEAYWNKWLHSDVRRESASQLRHFLEEDERFTLLKPTS